MFHVREGHRLGLLTFEPFDTAPAWVARLVERSFVATGLFFVLSGHILAQRFVRDDADGTPCLDRTARDFVLRRVTRIWPLHAAALLLLAPGVVWLSDGAAPAETLGAGVASLLLVQAWWPPWVLAWNVPTWALSTVASFYVVFAWVATRRPRALARRTRGAALAALGACVALALAPAVVVTLRADAPITSMSTGLDVLAVKFLPLVWWPVFAAGVVLARSPWGRPSGGAVCVRPGWGDPAWLALVALLVAPVDVPYLVLRHGLVVPLLLVGLVDLDRRRGVVAWVLARPVCASLGRASFAIFIVQLPVAGGLGAALAARRADGAPGSLLELAVVLAATVAVAWGASQLDRRAVAALRRRLGLAPSLPLATPRRARDDGDDGVAR